MSYNGKSELSEYLKLNMNLHMPACYDLCFLTRREMTNMTAVPGSA